VVLKRTSIQDLEALLGVQGGVLAVDWNSCFLPTSNFHINSAAGFFLPLSFVTLFCFYEYLALICLLNICFIYWIFVMSVLVVLVNALYDLCSTILGFHCFPYNLYCQLLFSVLPAYLDNIGSAMDLWSKEKH
jgi:hypothetical protein